MVSPHGIFGGMRYVIDDDFPGGNIIVERTEGKHVYIRPDLRDTEVHWFYWAFRVQSAGGMRLWFHLPDSRVLGVYGPAVSLDAGVTWDWLGAEAVSDNTFTFAFPSHANDVRFSVGIPYTEEHLRRFLARWSWHPHLETGILCYSEGGRAVERLRIGRLDGGARYRLILTARHHACEAMANYVLEGIMEAMLDKTDDGAWFCNCVEALIIPFVDKDGVEAGDQGKQRKPRDHNRDYSGKSLYASVRSIRETVPSWLGDAVGVALDLHCPGLKGGIHQSIHLVGASAPAMWAEQLRFSGHWERVQRGPLRFQTANNLPFGVAWNTSASEALGSSFATWAGQLAGIRLATSVEIPYSDAQGGVVTAETARLLGRDLAAAIRSYIMNSCL